MIRVLIAISSLFVISLVSAVISYYMGISHSTLVRNFAFDFAYLSMIAVALGVWGLFAFVDAVFNGRRY